MRNHKRGERDACAEKHSCKDQADDADGYPEAGTCGRSIGIQNCSGRCGDWGKCVFGPNAVVRVRRVVYIGSFGRHDQTVSLAWNRLDVEGLVRGITEDLAELVYCSVDVGVVVDVGIGGPEALAQFFASDDFTWFIEKRHQDLIYLSLQLDARAIPGDFLALLVNLKRTKTHKTRG